MPIWGEVLNTKAVQQHPTEDTIQLIKLILSKKVTFCLKINTLYIYMGR